MKFSELKKHIHSGSLAPCYTLYGDDAWVLNAAWKMFDAVAAGGVPEFNIEIFSEKGDLAKVLDACETLPMLGGGGDKRLVKADSPDTHNTAIAKLTKYLSNPNPDTVLVLRFGAALPEKLKGISGIQAVDCGRLDTATIIKWAKREAARYGASLTDAAAAKLTAYCLNNMSRISTEALKLAAYKYGGSIEGGDVEELVTADAEYKIFALTDALAANNRDLAYDVLDKLLTDRNQPIALLGLMYGSYRRMLHSRLAAGDPELSKQLGVKEAAVKISARQAQKYSKRKLYDTVKMFHQADLDFKSGGVTGRAGLEKLVFQMTDN